jgi:hypothetical protein
MTAFTVAHTTISLVAIVAGGVVVYGLLTSRRLEGWTAIYLVTIVATSVTGFGFPFDRLLPSHWFGIISLIVLAAVIPARYVFQLAGHWRTVFAVGVVLTLYLDVFVAVVQAFQKIPVLRSAAPTQSEPPFVIAQLATLLIFVSLGIAATIRARRAAIA